MNTPDEDYELVARRLDGEEVVLTPAQRALAEGIAADAEKVGPALEVSVPPGTLHRVSARVSSTLSRTEGRQAAAARAPARKKWLRWVGAAAAAAVVVAALLLPLSPEKPDTSSQAPTHAAVDMSDLVRTIDEFDARVEVLAEELADYRVRLALDEDFSAELALVGLEEEMTEFLLDEDEPGTLPGPQSWENSGSL